MIRMRLLRGRKPEAAFRSFPRRRIGTPCASMISIGTACVTWWKTPFYILSGGGELPLGMRKKPHRFWPSCRSGALCYGDPSCNDTI